MNQPRVLIVSNDDNNINEIEALLSRSNLNLVQARSCKEAVEKTERFEFAVVLIEVNSDFTEENCLTDVIRKDKKHEHLNILYIMDDSSETYHDKDLFDSGAVDFIARSFIKGILKGKVERMINQYNQRKQLELELEQREVIERELKEAKRLEEEAVVAKKQFLSMMSHEIRTPLNAIINTINLLITEKPRKDQAEDMDVLKFSAENLLHLINEILDFSKIDSGKVEFEEIEFNVRKLVTGIQQSLLYGMVKKGIALKFSVDDDVPTFLVGDSVRLAQIIFNLVGNALKFTEKGKVVFKASVHHNEDGFIHIAFNVSDTGIGIPEEKQQYIFDAFVQASASTTREYGGTGLGLTITKMLVEKQGGIIEVKSKPNVGSTFSVIMKFRKSRKNQQDVNPAKLSEIRSLDGMNVLVVEDNLINQNIVSRLLTKWNALADTAENGRIAVQKVSRNHYQLVLMDLHMPEMNGYEATQKIREMEGEYFKNLPILAVTASAFAEDRKKICDSGMNGYIIKPFHPAELNSKISHFLSRRVRA